MTHAIQMVIRYSIKLQIHQINNSQSIFRSALKSDYGSHACIHFFMTTLMLQSTKWLMFDGGAEKRRLKEHRMQLNLAPSRFNKRWTEQSWEFLRGTRHNTVKQMIRLQLPPSCLLHVECEKLIKNCGFARELKYIRSGSRLYSRSIENKSCTTRFREWKHALCKLRMEQISTQ